jgi:2-deoxy-D-gluconate 3-dehydrogenase
MHGIEEKPMSELLDLSGKSAIVTGGAMGIGYGIAQRLAKAGAQVLISDINLKALENAAQRLTDKGCEVKALHADVSQEKDVEKIFTYAVENLGGVDILVNNAGIYPMSMVVDMPTEEWESVLSVNLKGTFFCCREAARRMVAQNRGGAIINISSIDAFHPSQTGLAHYDASKGGVDGITRNLALELAPHNIRVISVNPGGVLTEGIEESASLTVSLKEFYEAFEAKIPMGRMGHPDDIARVVVFLASDASAYITGTTIVVDGGVLLN